MTQDLAIVAADKQIAHTLEGLLSRPQSIGIRPIQPPTIVEHPHRDPGVWKRGHELLAFYANDHAHGLVVLDHAWDGNPYDRPEELARTIEESCRPAWGERAKCIVIDPELENWVWTRSQRVAKELRWPDYQQLGQWLAARGHTFSDMGKPQDPKAAYQDALREKQLPASARLFRRLAENVSFRSCRDPAFLSLLSALRSWFPPALEEPGVAP